MQGGGRCICAEASVVRKLMALFSLSVKRGRHGSNSLCVGGRSVLAVHSVGSGELSYGVFCALLGSGVAQGGVCGDLGVDGSELGGSSK